MKFNLQLSNDGEIWQDTNLLFNVSTIEEASLKQFRAILTYDDMMTRVVDEKGEVLNMPFICENTGKWIYHGDPEYNRIFDNEES